MATRTRLGMTLTRAVHNALTQATPPTPTTFNGLVKAAGGTKAAAARLGIGQRQVERLAKQERGEQGQTRGKRSLAGHTDTLRKAVAEENKQKLARDIKQSGGARIQWSGELQISQTIEEREIDVDVPAEFLEEMLEAWERGDDDTAAGEFQKATMNTYDVAGVMPRDDTTGDVKAFMVATAHVSIVPLPSR